MERFGWEGVVQKDFFALHYMIGEYVVDRRKVVEHLASIMLTCSGQHHSPVNGICWRRSNNKNWLCPGDIHNHSFWRQYNPTCIYTEFPSSSITHQYPDPIPIQILILHPHRISRLLCPRLVVLLDCGWDWELFKHHSWSSNTARYFLLISGQRFQNIEFVVDSQINYFVVK